MSELKVTAAHLRRAAVVYVRQSTLAQVDRNRESTARQYDLVARAERLGWPRSAVRVIDDDLGVSGASTAGRSGFAELAAQVGLGQVGIVLSLEVLPAGPQQRRLVPAAGPGRDDRHADRRRRRRLPSRVVQRPAAAGHEGHHVRGRAAHPARPPGRRDPQQGRPRRAAPRPAGRAGVGRGRRARSCWHPDEAVTGVIAAIFDRFAVCGSVRGVWLWLREQGLRFPLQPAAYLRGAGDHLGGADLPRGAQRAHPPRLRRRLRVRQDPPASATSARTACCAPGRRKLPQGEWEVLIPDHHRGFIDWDTYQANQARIGANTRPRAHQPGTGAVREGCALLQGPGHLRDLRPQARRLLRRPGAKPPPATTAPAPASSSTAAAPGTCASAASRSTPPWPPRSWPRCSPPRCRPAWPPPSNSRTATTPRSQQWRRQVEQARYDAGQGRAPLPGRRPGQPAGRPRPGNRVGHRAAPAGRRRDRTRPPRGRAPENPDPARETGDPRPRRRPRRGVVGADHHRPGPQGAAAHPARRGRHQRAPRPRPGRADLVLRWKGGAITELSVPLKRKPPQRLRTDEDTIDLLRRLAVHYPDATDRRHPQPATPPHRTGTVVHRRYGSSHCATTGTSPATSPATAPHRGRTAHRGRRRRTNSDSPPSTLHRWLSDGFIAGEQTHPRRALADPPHRRHPRAVRRRRPRRAGWPCSRPPSPTASPGRP